MPLESEIAPTVPRIFVLTRDEKHGRELAGALSRRFDLSVFDDTQAARDAMNEMAPEVVLAEADMMQGGRLDWLLPSSGSSAGVIFIAKQGEEMGGLLKLFGKTGRFLRWPISARALLQTISELLSQTAEKAWEALPEVQKKSLKMTVEEYQVIATQIENGE
ncbi:MAG: hypothetical protein QGF09_15520, partial [Rhodospirillales bacterium]|nr:hypothetical protein [Rhodospirillales bacterium]